jgi:CheY-like chemotaxis protein
LADRLLRRLGYRVLACPDPGEALAASAAHAEPIHLLLTDVVMPGMNGRALAGRIAETRPDLRVLFTSGYTENVVVQHGVLEEGLHFLAKPYSPDGLARKVRQVLDGGR